MLALFEIIDSDRVPLKRMANNDSRSNVTTGSNHNPRFSQSNYSAADSRESLHSSHSSTSVPGSKEWFRRLASYASMSPSSLGSISDHQEMSNEMVELISRCVHKCGEERGYIPLFKVLFSTLNGVEENRYTRLLDGRARDILLTGVIMRMVYHVSKYTELVFICDDIQCKYEKRIRMPNKVKLNK